MRAIFALAATFLAPGCALREPPPTVERVDLARYAGVWHEAARLPNFFQRACAGPATAEYLPLPDGSLRVVNVCRDARGRERRVEGRAVAVPGSGNAKLKVSFGGPFAGDYWIHALDTEGYTWAIVGHPSRRFLWILTRGSHPPRELVDELVRKAGALGYTTSRIQRWD